MAVYAIFNLREVLDHDAWDEYRSKVRATYESHGARTIAAGDGARVVEGDWSGIRNVIIEFPDMDTFDGWYGSEAYRPLLELRTRATRGDFVVLNGV